MRNGQKTFVGKHCRSVVAGVGKQDSDFDKNLKI